MTAPATTYQVEGGGWLVRRCPVPGLAEHGAAELLVLGARLPGSMRYVRDTHGVAVLAEARALAGGESLPEARERLELVLAGMPEGPVPAAETVEAALEAAGLGWSRRDQGWAVPASDRVPREVRVRAVPGGARVEATLAEWDEAGAAERDALAAFLLAAQAGLRGARCELADRGARLVAAADADRLDSDLADALLSVAVACRLLARAAAALLSPEVARIFQEFHQPLAA
jgi:hypothetical protein